MGFKSALVVLSAGLLCPISFAQTVTIGPNDVNKRVYVSNAVFQTNSSGHYEQVALARIALETYRSHPNLNPADAIAELTGLRNQYNAAPSAPESFTSMKEKVDTMLDLGASLSGKYAGGVQVAKVAFDMLANSQEQELTVDARVLDSLSSATTYADTQRTQEETWEQLYDDAVANPKLGKVVSALFSATLKANVGDDAETIFKANSAFSDHEDIKFIRAHLNDGALTIDKAVLSRLAAGDIQGVLDTLQTDRVVLADVQKKQNDLLAYVRNESAKQAARDEVEKQWQTDQLKLGAAQAGVNILAGIARLAGEDSAAKTIEATGTAAVQIVTALNQYSRTIATLGDDVSGFGAAVLTGNIASAVFQVIGSFGGPSTDEQILKQLAALRQDVQELHEDMSYRFTLVDKRLDELSDQIDMRFNILDLHVGAVKGDTHQILSELSDLQSQIRALQVLTTAIAQQQARTALAHQMDAALFLKSRGRAKPTKTDLQSWEGYFFVYATRDAGTPIFQPVTGRDTSPTALDTTFASFSNYENISLLLQYLHSRYPAATSDWSTTSVVNPYDWSLASVAYLEVCREIREYTRQGCEADRVRTVLDAGETTRAALRQLIYKGDGTPNKELLAKLISSYESALQQINEGIANEMKKQLSEVNPRSPAIAQQNENLDLWAGHDQPTSYFPQTSSIDRCPEVGKADGNPVLNPIPDNPSAKVPNLYRLAEQLGLGTVTICLPYISYTDMKLIQVVPVTAYWDLQPNLTYDFEFNDASKGLLGADMYMTATTGVPYFGVYNNRPAEAWADWINSNWTTNLNLRARYNDGTLLYPNLKKAPAGALNDQEAWYLSLFSKNETTVDAQVDGELQDLQLKCYRSIFDALTTGELKQLAVDLSGAKQVLIQYAALGMPSTVNNNDLLRSLLFGSQSLLDGNGVAALYHDSVANGQPGQSVVKIDMMKIGSERLDAAEGQLESALQSTTEKKTSQSYELLDAAIARFAK